MGDSPNPWRAGGGMAGMAMTPALVAVSSGASFDGRGVPRMTLNLSYLRALEAAGAAPLTIAPGMDRDGIAGVLKMCSGLVLTGGGDVAPARYGQEPTEHLKFVSDERDALEFAAIEAADAAGVPILAICRGMQVLNVSLGGSLVQDIPAMVEGALAHAVEEPRYAPAHPVEVAAGSRLAAIVGAGRTEVNSRHHQALAELGKGLVVTARAPDGIVEAVELPGKQFVLGVQWHPEDMADRAAFGPSAERLFAAFVEAARQHR